MHRLFLAAFLLLPLAAQAELSTAAKARVNIAEAPIGRLSLPWWETRWEQTLSNAKATPDAQIVWLGDSITQYWQRQGTLGYDNILPVWNHYYAPFHALDFGFVGDTTASLIWRLDHGQVAGLHPRLTIILIGANNLGHVHWGAQMTIPAIESVVANAHSRLPDSHILLLAVLPSIRSPWVDSQTALINTALAEHYAGNPTVTFVNADSVLLKDGHTDASLFVDPREVPPHPALHPDATGMSRLAEYIEPYVAKYVEMKESSAF
jgi:lysophospholipase L1-like esterase